MPKSGCGLPAPKGSSVSNDSTSDALIYAGFNLQSNIKVGTTSSIVFAYSLIEMKNFSTFSLLMPSPAAIV